MSPGTPRWEIVAGLKLVRIAGAMFGEGEARAQMYRLMEMTVRDKQSKTGWLKRICGNEDG